MRNDITPSTLHVKQTHATFADSCSKITSEVSSVLKNDAVKLTRLQHHTAT